ncbi:type IIL restriction-modification enzyme MmeI [Corynebacterium hadale]|uniref:type IIL restriction-modification enzyme MmeI n=1 Tax=Corynebacterium hadale TaxID=2026255 RepID=UPI0030B87B60
MLRARERHPQRSLAEHYNPLSMDPILLKAHNNLDREVDKAFDVARKLTNERQRQGYCSPATGSWRGAMSPRFHQNRNHQQGRSPCG